MDKRFHNSLKAKDSFLFGSLLTRSENWLLFSMAETNFRKKHNQSYLAEKLPLQI